MGSSGWALDASGRSSFIEVLGPLFETAPRFLARLAAGRPFGSWESLFAGAEQLALALPSDEAVELLDAHPRIGAPRGAVSALSFREQGYDLDGGSNSVSLEAERARVQAALDHLNDAYEARFGFRFVIFVAGRPRSAIIALMQEALANDRESEMRRGLADVVAIARDRATRTGLREAYPEPRTEGGAGT
jgi:2-oxo-4-hydroxy-4-carboxy--5-ureidoimidazoline (OHCU) decarboxylase